MAKTRKKRTVMMGKRMSESVIRLLVGRVDKLEKEDGMQRIVNKQWGDDYRELNASHAALSARFNKLVEGLPPTPAKEPHWTDEYEVGFSLIRHAKK